VRARPISLGLLSFLIVVGFAPTRSVLSSNSDISTLLFTVAKRYEPLAWVHGGERFSSDATIFLQDAGGRRPLLSGFAASADPAVSFDGKRVLFAGKQKSQDPWQIWEVELDSVTSSGEPHRLTSCEEDCVRPFYLPEDRFVYAKKTDGRFVMEAADRADGKGLRLTYGPGSYLPTDVLRDGRILFEASYPLGSDRTPEIYTVYSDGSGVEAYRCDHGKKRHSGKQVSSGDIVFASGSSLGRFTSARAQEVAIAAAVGEYAGEIAEASSGDWLLAWRPDANSNFAVMRWRPGESRMLPVVAEQNSNAIQPVLVEERAVPKRHPSGLHDWPNANLLCLNAYTSKYKFAAESIHSVRLYTRDNAGNPKLLGLAPVERDGSFFVQVSGDEPLQIELLDSSGKTLKRESGWFWTRRGEQRACVGCHAGPETAPENAVPMILLRSTTPADMTDAARGNAGGQ